ANIVGFGDAGPLISGNNRGGSSSPSELAVADFGYNGGGGRTDRHLRFLADVIGDGLLDIVEFGENQLLIRRNNGNGAFQSVRRVIDDFGYSQGWLVEKHPRFVVDLTGDGRADIIGFGGNSVWVSYNNGDGTFQLVRRVIDDFGYDQGWRVEKHPRFVIDLTGESDGCADIIGFGENSVCVSYNNGDGTFQSFRRVIDDFGYSQGWLVEKHPRFVVDLTGDGRADIIGFGVNSVCVSYNNGDGTFQSFRRVIDDFGYNQGWRVEKHPRFVVDLMGDGHADIIGFGEDSVCVSYNNGDGTFQSFRRVIDDFGYSQGWRVEKHPRFVIDLTGDGRADIIGFGENSVCVSYNNGGGNFGPVTKLVDNFAYSGGWTFEKVVRCIANIYR
ncbi:lectin PVL, partial [Mycena sanguinolenta]